MPMTQVSSVTNLTMNVDSSSENDDVGAVDGSAVDAAQVVVSNNENASNGGEQLPLEPWQESPWAIGRCKMTWKEDRLSSWSELLDSNHMCTPQTCCSAHVCGCLGAGRLGNFVLLWPRTVPAPLPDRSLYYRHRSRQHCCHRPRTPLRCIVGPYWPVLLCWTLPLIVGVSVVTCFRSRLWTMHVAVIVIWSVLTLTLIFILLVTACTDPGIQPRYLQVPTNGITGRADDHDDDLVDDDDDLDWRYNSQAYTYRLRRDHYDPDCNAIVQHFDHTCPWTGTAIGARNMDAFRAFVGFVFVMLLVDVVLLLRFRI